MYYTDMVKVVVIDRTNWRDVKLGSLRNWLGNVLMRWGILGAVNQHRDSQLMPHVTGQSQFVNNH